MSKRKKIELLYCICKNMSSIIMILPPSFVGKGVMFSDCPVCSFVYLDRYYECSEQLIKLNIQ